MAGLLDLWRLTQGQADPNANTQTPPYAPTAPGAPTTPPNGLMAAYLEWMKRQQEEQQKGVEGTPQGMDAGDAMRPPPQVTAAPAVAAPPAPAPQQKSGGGLLNLFKMFF